MIKPTLLRSALYLPGSNDRALAKAAELAADALIFDLEDSVAPERKAEARDAVIRVLGSAEISEKTAMVRINPQGSTTHGAELAAFATAPLMAVLVPKVSSAAEVVALSAALDAAGYRPEVGLAVMIETPASILALRDIAGMTKSSRLAGLVLGLNDLAKDSGIAQLAGRAAFQPVLTMAVLAARANGLFVLDGVCNAIDDPARLESEARQAREGGFDGKTLIHPSQIGRVNSIFAPSAAECAEAAAIVAAFADPANAGRGALRINGAMAERLHLAQAEALLARAAQIAAQEGQAAT